MAFEMVDKKTIGAGCYGPRWENEPCVAINKTGVTFNRKFGDMFGVRKGDLLAVFIDKVNHKVGFKTPSSDAEMQHGFAIHGGERRKADDRGRIAKAFPHCVGRAFVVRMAPGQHIIEAQLDAPPVVAVEHVNGEANGDS